MLNTCLTVRARDAGSHSGRGWEQFTDKVVDVVDRYGGANLPTSRPADKSGHGRGVVFLAWGSWAAKRVAKLDEVRAPHSVRHTHSIKPADRSDAGTFRSVQTKHLILTSAVRSPIKVILVTIAC